MRTKKLLLAATIQSALFAVTPVLAGDVEVSLPAASDAFTVDQPAGTELMRVNGDGNVGIGTDSPQTLLDIHGDTAAYLTLRDGDAAKDAGGQHAGIRIRDGNGDQTGYMGFNTSVEGLSIQNLNDDGGIHLSTGGNNNQLVVTADGSVTINTGLPSDGTANGGQPLKLDVEGAVGATHFCDENGENCVASADLGGGGASNPACEDISARASGVATAKASGAWTNLPIANESFDTDDAFSTTAGTYTIPKAGKYRVTVRVNGGNFTTHPVFLGAYLTLNGTATAANYQTSHNGLVYPIIEINTLREFSAGDVLAVQGYHNAGTTKNLAVLEFLVSHVNPDCGNGNGGSADNLGDHTATQDIDLAANKLVGNGGTEGVTVDAAGNVGIGTTTPGSELHVADNDGDNVGQLILNGGTSGNGSLKSHTVGGNQLVSLGPLGISEALNIRNINGYVGINNTNPQRILHVTGGVQADNTHGSLVLKRNEDYTAVGHGNGLIGGLSPKDNLLGYFGYTNTTVDPDDPQGRFFIQLDTNNDQVNQTTEHHFNVTHTGNVGIGTITPAHPLEMGSGAHVTAAGVWTSASDISKKDNIKEINYGLDTVMKLKPSEYDYRTDSSHSIGFIAQEIEKIIPEVVSGEDGSKGVAYGSLTAVLVKAMQQQQAQIAAQQQRIEALEAKLQQ